MGVFAGVVGVGHHGDGGDATGLFAERAAVVVNHIACDVLPHADFFAARFFQMYFSAACGICCRVIRCAWWKNMHQLHSRPPLWHPFAAVTRVILTTAPTVHPFCE
jgi:hypothetical protein